VAQAGEERPNDAATTAMPMPNRGKSGSGFITPWCALVLSARNHCRLAVGYPMAVATGVGL